MDDLTVLYKILTCTLSDYRAVLYPPRVSQLDQRPSQLDSRSSQLAPRPSQLDLRPFQLAPRPSQPALRPSPLALKSSQLIVRTDRQTDGWKMSPFYRTSSTTGAAALLPLRKLKRKL